MSSKTNVKDFLNEVDEDLLKTLIDFSKPSNKFGDIYISDVTQWKFCDVIDYADDPSNDIILRIVNTYGYKEINGIRESVSITDRDLSKGSAKEFVALLKHVRNEFEKVAALMSQLKNEPDDIMTRAGIGNMDKFGAIGIYYSIDKNPLSWDAISEIPFGKMYTRLLIDKTMSDIERKKNEIISNEMKHKKI